NAAAGARRLLAGNVAGVVRLTGHGGTHAVAAARQHGVSVMFTLSGGHVFPLYDAVVKDGADTAMRLVDVRHEQTAVFAAEATARLAGSVDEAFRLAASPHRGPVFLDISLEAIYGQAEADLAAAGPDGPGPSTSAGPAPDADEVDHIARLLRTARHPVLVLGSD